MVAEQELWLEGGFRYLNTTRLNCCRFDIADQLQEQLWKISGLLVEKFGAICGKFRLSARALFRRVETCTDLHFRRHFESS